MSVFKLTSKKPEKNIERVRPRVAPSSTLLVKTTTRAQDGPVGHKINIHRTNIHVRLEHEQKIQGLKRKAQGGAGGSGGGGGGREEPGRTQGGRRADAGWTQGSGRRIAASRTYNRNYASFPQHYSTCHA